MIDKSLLLDLETVRRYSRDELTEFLGKLESEVKRITELKNDAEVQRRTSEAKVKEVWEKLQSEFGLKNQNELQTKEDELVSSLGKSLGDLKSFVESQDVN